MEKVYVAIICENIRQKTYSGWSSTIENSNPFTQQLNHQTNIFF